MQLKVILSAIALSLFISIETIIIRWINLNNDIKIPSEQLVLLIEFCKVVMSYILYKIGQRSHYQPIQLTDENEESSILW